MKGEGEGGGVLTFHVSSSGMMCLQGDYMLLVNIFCACCRGSCGCGGTSLIAGML